MIVPDPRLGPVPVVIDVDGIRKITPPMWPIDRLLRSLREHPQYTPADSPIGLHTTVSGDGLTILVRDHGAGISPADLPHLFDRFYRGSEAKRRISGTGMGLSIARGMLAVQRGRIWAENCADGGAQFTIVVPAEVKIAAGSLS